MSAWRRLGAGCCSGLAAALLLLGNARAGVRDSSLGELLPGWRGWDDLAIAAGYQVSGDYPVAPYRITNRFRRDREDFLAFRAALEDATARAGIRPRQFWRTVGLAEGERFLARRWDDPGRALLLAFWFRALGGVAPYLLTWLGVLLALPALLWLAVELSLGGRALAGAVLAALLAGSGFVGDVLRLGYSSAGFAFLALVLTSGLAAYAWFGRPTARGLLLRSLLAGCLFGWLVAARSASLLTLGGAALALGVAAARGVSPRRQRLIVGAGALLLYLAPSVAVYRLNDALLQGTLERLGIRRRPAQQHDVWVTLWQGLGDFDRSKGHAFLDKAGELEARRHGSSERLSPASEALFKRLVLRDIRQDPYWYAAILARRTWATLAQSKLWPWHARAGRSFAPAEHANEGVTDAYYAMVLGADSFRFGSRTWEAPISLLLLPSLGLLLVAAAPVSARPGARRGLAAMACVALAALPTPVLITTASGFETQSFVIVHFLGIAFLAQAAADEIAATTAARAGARSSRAYSEAPRE